MKKLSICIPVYNRKKYLAVLLNEVVAQIEKEGVEQDVQICISDNCSVDGTEEYISDMAAQNPNIDIQYNKNSQNIGADRNFLKCVEIAQAEFCWLMGSDDLLMPDAIKTILNKLDKYNNMGVMIGRRVACNKYLKPLFSDRWVKSNSDYICNFGNKKEIIDLFQKFNSTTGMCSLLSIIVFNKKEWDNVKNAESYIGSLYIQTYMCFSLLMNSKRDMVYITDQIIYARIGNDAFYENLGQRIMMDLRGFTKIADVFENVPEVKNAFLEVLLRCYDTPFLCAWKLSAKNMGDEENKVFSKLKYTQTQKKILESKSFIYVWVRFFSSVFKMLFTAPSRFYVYTRTAIARFI